MKVKYTAIGENNQKLEGVLDAQSIDAAREELHKMNLSIIAVNEISEEEAAQSQPQQTEVPIVNEQGETEAPAPSEKKNIDTYFFSAKDGGQKEVNGTIDASEPESAYRRLITEYGFDVTDLYPNGSPDPVSDSLKGQFEEWRKMFEEEGIDLSPKSRKPKNELEEGEEMSEEIINEIDQFIINTKKILSDHKGQYSRPFFKEIEKTLGELERVRASNNLKHITKVCNNLYELVAHPDMLPSDENENQSSNQEYESIVSKLRTSGFVSNQMAFLQAHNLKKKGARFDKIQKIFTKIIGKLNKKQGELLTQRLINRKKRQHNKWLSHISKSLSGKDGEPHVTIRILIQKFFQWVSAPNKILRRARKQELMKAYYDWKRYKENIRNGKIVEKKDEGADEKERNELESKFANFFAEIDSFISWLLFFYITYFFLASFALEKNIGLPQTLILKTFNSNLLVNIAIFLLITHLAFSLKLRYFRRHFLSSIFLFFFCFGVYRILILNF